MAKGEGFEPSIRDKPYTRLAGERLQPLGHPFIRLLFSSRFELLASPVARNERAFTLPFAFVQVLFFKSCIFFASLTANATFPPLSAISLGLFSGIWGRPISLSLNTGFCRPISLSLNTGFWRLLPVGQYAAFPGLRYAYPGLCSGAGRCPFPRAIYGEGVGRQAGGEVKFSHAIYGEQGERPCRSSSIGFAVV